MPGKKWFGKKKNNPEKQIAENTAASFAREENLEEIVADMRRRLERDKFNFEAQEQELQKLEQDNRCEILEQEINRVQEEYQERCKKNKKVWRKVWILCSLVLILGVGAIGYFYIEQTDDLQQLKEELDKKYEDMRAAYQEEIGIVE